MGNTADVAKDVHSSCGTPLSLDLIPNRPAATASCRAKVAYMSHQAWGDRERGGWPADIAESTRHEYDLPTIARWLEVFLYRFFQLSQFKRSCLPNGPKVGSGGSLSPRSDWRAPSDAEALAWLDELHANLLPSDGAGART